MDALNKSPFKVALKAHQLNTIRVGFSSELRLNHGQGVAAINSRLPLPKQVEVWTINEQNVHGQKAVSAGLIVSISQRMTYRLVNSPGVVRVGARVVNGGGL